ncbi:unnamed protein product [Adineta ricciae]|uniref:JmjC domain-containing protein n=1 Tax=Adineta ricciae TaxID=249248 RepID=A0A815YU63_ADIRI|nr:unnamed protein product [Adineta ricciae]
MILLTILFLSLNQVGVSSTDMSSGFPKDMNLYVTFPPILQHHESLALGHLRPLGWQRRAEAPIIEDSLNIDPERFYNLFVRGNRSVVIRGIVSPMDVLWTDTYLSKRYGHLNVTAAKRKQRLVDTLVMTPLKTFLQQYRQDDLYMNTIIPDEMKLETPFPSVINCGTIRSRLIEPILWISAGDTASLLQAHAQHTLHCVLDGRKDFIIYDLANHYPHEFNLVKQANGDLFSRIDVDLVNAYKYKYLHEAPWYWTTLREGDCLFVPAYKFHQIRAHGRTLALTIDFAPTNIREEFLGTDCEKNPPVYVPLSQAPFLWRYEHAVRHLSKRSITSEDVRNYLFLLFGANEELHQEIFRDFYLQVTDELDKKSVALPTGTDVWKQLNKDEPREEFMTRDHLKNLSADRLQLLADILQKSARIHEYHKHEL